MCWVATHTSLDLGQALERRAGNHERHDDLRHVRTEILPLVVHCLSITWALARPEGRERG